MRSSHPVLAWTLPAGEQSREIYIARSPSTTPAGEFYAEKIVTRAYGDLSPTALQWAPKDPLYAGSYWWNVESRDADYQSSFSVPSRFTITRALAISSARVEYLYGLDWAEITIRYRTNLETLMATGTVSIPRCSGPASAAVT